MLYSLPVKLRDARRTAVAASWHRGPGQPMQLMQQRVGGVRELVLLQAGSDGGLETFTARQMSSTGVVQLASATGRCCAVAASVFTPLAHTAVFVMPGGLFDGTPDGESRFAGVRGYSGRVAQPVIAVFESWAPCTSTQRARCIDREHTWRKPQNPKPRSRRARPASRRSEPRIDRPRP